MALLKIIWMMDSFSILFPNNAEDFFERCLRNLNFAKTILKHGAHAGKTSLFTKCFKVKMLSNNKFLHFFVNFKRFINTQAAAIPGHTTRRASFAFV